MEEITMRVAFGHVRVSTEDQADSGLGLDAQRQRIRAYCELRGLQLAEILEDPGVSGAKALSTRPAGAPRLALARKSKPVVLVAKFDRLLRSVADAAQTIRAVGVSSSPNTSRSGPGSGTAATSSNTDVASSGVSRPAAPITV
jgi:hypothetical protein